MELFVVLRKRDIVTETISRLGRKTLDILSIVQQFEEIDIQFTKGKYEDR